MLLTASDYRVLVNSGEKMTFSDDFSLAYQRPASTKPYLSYGLPGIVLADMNPSRQIFANVQYAICYWLDTFFNLDPGPKFTLQIDDSQVACSSVKSS